MKKRSWMALAMIAGVSGLGTGLWGAQASEPACEDDNAHGSQTEYDEQGRLTFVQDDAEGARLSITYDPDLIDVSETTLRKGKWRPNRWSIYGAHSGKLKTIHTYEDFARGLQTTFEIPATHDLASGKDPQGRIWYTGPSTQETVAYERVNEKVRTVLVTEPVNVLKDGCIRLAGQSYTLRLPQPKAEESPAPKGTVKITTEGGTIIIRPEAGEEEGAEGGEN